MNAKTLIIGIIFGILASIVASTVLNEYGARNSGGDATTSNGHSGIESGFAEQRQLLEDSRRTVASLETTLGAIESETTRARTAINDAQSISGRATDRIQKILDQMEILIDSISGIERVLTDFHNNSGNEQINAPMAP